MVKKLAEVEVDEERVVDCPFQLILYFCININIKGSENIQQGNLLRKGAVAKELKGRLGSRMTGRKTQLTTSSRWYKVARRGPPRSWPPPGWSSPNSWRRPGRSSQTCASRGATVLHWASFSPLPLSAHSGSPCSRPWWTVSSWQTRSPRSLSCCPVSYSAGTILPFTYLEATDMPSTKFQPVFWPKDTSLLPLVLIYWHFWANICERNYMLVSFTKYHWNHNPKSTCN